MSILFSPIGTADPMTQLGDGPMLHIVRHRAPKKVVLFLSPAMAEHQREDGRYVKAIELLSDSLGRSMPEVQLVESSFKEVYRFDHYIEEFEQVLQGLAAESEGRPVLVNASSGTPGMEQALVALGAFGRLNLELLQVTSPRNDANKPHDREDSHDYDLDLLWELNEDGHPDAKMRIHSVDMPNFSNRLLRENVIALVRCYEYEAADVLARQMTCANPKALEMIRAAADRLNLDHQRPARVFGGTELSYRANDPLSEHLYVMEARLKQGHWADFIRLLTPALTEFMKRALRPYLPEGRYLQMGDNGLYTDRYNWEKVSQDERLSLVLRRKMSEGKVFADNDALMMLIREYCDDEGVVGKVERLRRMEQRCRNLLAHTITSSARSRLEKEGGLSLDEVLAYLFDLHGGLKPGLYDRISAAIVDLL